MSDIVGLSGLVVNGFALDLSDSIAVPVDFSIADVKDFTKRARNKTKEIVLPHTPRNLAFFIGNYGFTSTEGGISFDATTKHPTSYAKEGRVIFFGMMQLKKITQLNGKLKFHVGIYSEITDAFLTWQNTKVSELDWTAYNHTLNKTTISDSWNATAGTGYYYPLIERGLGRLAPDQFRTTDLVPYVYAHEIFQKAFDLAGLTIQSTHINSNDFKNILFGYGGGELVSLGAVGIANRGVSLSNGTISSTLIPTNYGYSTVSTFGTLPPNEVVSTEVSDFFNQNISGEITVSKTGKYNLLIGGLLNYNYEIFNLAGAVLPVTGVSGGQIQFVVNGNIVGTSSLSNSSTAIYSETISASKIIELNSGDVVHYLIKVGNVTYTPDPTIVSVSCILTASNFALNFSSLDKTITDGDTLELPLFIPDMTISDFISGIVKHQNLYISDPDDNGVVIIEPLSQYYLPTTDFKDITQQIDHSKEISTTPTGNTLAKKLSWKFKQNKDLEAIRYSNLFDSEYGDYYFDQQSYFAKGEMKTELPFGTIIPYDLAPIYPTHKVYAPRFVKQNSSGNIEPYKGIARIMYRVPKVTGSIWFSNANGTDSTVVTSLPLVHHFNSYTAPTLDMNFGLVRELYYPATIVTSKNAYSEYHYTFINELTSSAGKLITLSVKWDVSDIYNLQFQKLININGGRFRLNKVLDFDNDISLTTKIELVKVLTAKNKNVGSLPHTDSEPLFSARLFTPNAPTYEVVLTQRDMDSPSVVRSIKNTGNISAGQERTGTGVYSFSGFSNLGEGTVITTTPFQDSLNTIKTTILSATEIQIETFASGTPSDNLIPNFATNGYNFVLKIENNEQ